MERGHPVRQRAQPAQIFRHEFRWNLFALPAQADGMSALRQLSEFCTERSMLDNQNTNMEKPAQTDYPIIDLLKRRWSPRTFSDRIVEPEKLLSLFEATRWAASSFNEQPWYFVLATKQEPEEHARLLGCLAEKNQQWASQAPVLMVSIAKLKFEKTGKPNRHAFHDVGLAVGNLIVQATAMDLFVHQMAGFSPQKVSETYRIPDDFEPVAAIAVGYGVDEKVLPEPFRAFDLGSRSRKPIGSFVFESTWGQAAPLVSQ